MNPPILCVPPAESGADDDAAWAPLRDAWTMPQGVTFLNHGSFGLTPRCVVEAQQRLLVDAATNPMHMFADRFEPEHIAARDRLGDLVGADRHNLVMVDNATYGMNVVAACFPLKPDDEVLITDHDYGAVVRTWERACRRAGARLATVTLPNFIESPEQVIDAIFQGVTPRTRLLVVSHVTSPTALKLPVEEICRRAKQQGIRTCVDGPHAVAMLPLALDALGCDFYTASCHKWLSAGFGTGFLYVRPDMQQIIEPLVVSWGRTPPAKPETWQDWFLWVGTRDVSAMLSVPVAIDFLAAVGWERFRARTHHLAQRAREMLLGLRGFSPLTPDSDAWYGPMIAVRSEHRDPPGLRQTLRREHRIEVPIIPWQGKTLVRVSCHLYTRPAELETLLSALKKEL